MDLYAEEKRVRLNSDKEGSKSVLIELADTASTPEEAYKIIREMSKKKGQIKASLQEMILHAYRKYEKEYNISVQDNSYRIPQDIDINNITPDIIKEETTPTINNPESEPEPEIQDSSLSGSTSINKPEIHNQRIESDRVHSKDNSRSDHSKDNSVSNKSSESITEGSVNKNDSVTGCTKDTIRLSSDGDSVFLRFILSVLEVVEGSIEMEDLRLFLTDSVKQMYMSAGYVQEAFILIYNVNAETFTSLPQEHVLAYQLEQMRLALLARDYHRARLVALKISRKQLIACEYTVPFWRRMLFLHVQSGDTSSAAAVCNALRVVDENARVSSVYPVLTVIFSILSIQENFEKSRYLIRLSVNSKMAQEEDVLFGKYFLENIQVNPELLQKLLHQVSEKYNLQFLHAFQLDFEKICVIYNIFVFSKYFTKISLGSLLSTLSTRSSTLDESAVLSILEDMIRKGSVHSSIIENAGIVEFSKNQPERFLSEKEKKRISSGMELMEISVDEDSSSAVPRVCSGRSESVEDWSKKINSCLDGIIRITHGMNNV
ncbi:26S proteasome regulatory subunit N5 [Nematocida sp. AWRm79]|nr:26S proteasome regulatory subunit N5 [Nematocida sp. AWRm79]